MSGSASLHTIRPYEPERATEVRATARIVSRFGQLNDPLVQYIQQSEVVLGCVAWLTDWRVLDTLRGVSACAFAVQKEPMWKGTSKRATRMRKAYQALPGGIPLSMFPSPLKHLRARSGPDVLGAVNPVGWLPVGRHTPLMHHKFIVRARRVGDALEPLAVWTGSFNFSQTANRGFENGVEIHSPDVADAYLREFARVAALSEPLMWTSREPAPFYTVSRT